jgi:hypothetical protein
MGREGRLMGFLSIVWDLDDEPDGNVQHCLEHGVTKEEVEDVVQDPSSRRGVSRSSGLPALFGNTRTGRHLIVVYEVIDDDTIYPVTAYDVDRRVVP